MKTTLQSVAMLPVLALSALAASPNFSCRTELGSKSVAHVPTVTSTITQSAHPTVTQIVQPTITTSIGYYQTFTHWTKVTRTYTDPTITDTFSTTTTLYTVETDTVTSTITTTTTQTSTTSSTSTTEVATTAGFVDIGQSINSNAYQRRAVVHPHAGSQATAQGVLAMSYPTRVACTETVANPTTKTVFVTTTPVTSTVNFLASTTKVRTIASTVTVVPADVSTTLTFSSTSSVTTFVTSFPTLTQTTSTTTTEIIPGPTVYDACQDSNNYFGSDFTSSGNGYYVVNAANNGPGISSDFDIVADGAGSALECCNACQAFGTCETFLFRAEGRTCLLLYHPGETCNSQANHPNFLLSKYGSDTGAGYVAGNGNCGYTYSGNSDGSVFRVG